MSLFSELRRRNVIRVAIAYSVVAWLVAQVAELALSNFGTPDWIIKTILFVLVAGLPFAIIFAWAYELTPGGIKREEDVEPSDSIADKTGRKLNYVIIAVLAIALILSVATRDVKFGADESRDDIVITDEAIEGDKSIAVLAFVNMSDDPDNEFFSDGISEELLNALVKVDGLHVASRTSSFSFKGTDTPIPDIAEALKVDHVLEGSVRKAGQTVRITAQLIDVRTDRHLWSETYDRKLEDIFVIQDEISAHIVDALKIALGTGEITQTSSRPTQNVAAYEDYLRARHLWQRRGEDNIRQAIALFHRALEADPNFARAWSGLGTAHLTMPVYSNESDTEHFPLARKYAEKSLDLDPTIAEAHATIAELLRASFSWAESEEHYLLAIELEPQNVTSYIWYAEQLAATGRRELALTYALKALELDPFNTGANAMASVGYFVNDDVESAMQIIRSAEQLGYPYASFWLIQEELLRNNFDQAHILLEQYADDLGEDLTGTLEKFSEALQDPTTTTEYLDHLSGLDDPDPSQIAVGQVRLGLVDEGIDSLIRDQLWLIRIWAPDFKEVRKHERFAELLESVNLIDFWEEIGWPEQCSRDGELITCD